MDETEQSTEITSRVDFALWANGRAEEILRGEGADLAMAVKGGDETLIKECGLRLGAAISQALLEVFDGLVGD
jgi:hypothetical protein